MKNLYDIIIENPELVTLTAEISAHLDEKFESDPVKKILTLIATMGHGYNAIFTSLPNLIITSHILNEQLLASSDAITEDVIEISNAMIEFIKDFAGKIDNEAIQDITLKLGALTEKVSKQEGINESPVNSESD